MSKNKVIFKLDKNDSVVKRGRVLYRLICDGYKEEPKYEPRVVKGEKGGYVENLNQISTAVDDFGAVTWVDENSFVYGNSKVVKMLIYNSTIFDSTITGYATWNYIKDSTIYHSTVSGQVKIDDAYIINSSVKKFHIRNSTLMNCDIMGAKYNSTMYDATVSGLNGKFLYNITGEFNNELNQHELFINGKKVWICANHDVITVTYSECDIVAEGTWTPAEFMNLVYDHSNDKVKAIIEQFV
jgi:hypothetical protein